MYRLDKTSFRASLQKDVKNDTEYWLSRSIAERLAASWYLTCQAFGLEYSDRHKVDRTYFRMRKRVDRS